MLLLCNCTTEAGAKGAEGQRGALGAPRHSYAPAGLHVGVLCQSPACILSLGLVRGA